MNGFNLGNFGNQLQLDEMNGALANSGSTFQFEPPSESAPPGGGIQAPAAPTAQPLPPPAWEREKEEKQGGMGSILGMVGQFMGGAYGTALSAVGGMMGGGGQK